MKSKCHLCNQEKNLCLSHVIPKFVYKWHKDTSPTGFLRCGSEPNKRVQDGLKYYWLCDECETRLSSYETEFANHIFHPMNHGNTLQIKYGSWFLKFCVSVSWRVLNFHLKENRISHLSSILQDYTHNAYMIWKEFLLDQRPHPDQHEQHFLPLDVVINYTHKDTPSNINRYILRCIEFNLAKGVQSAFTYAKLGKFIIVGFIKMPYPKHWKGTKVHVNNGLVSSKKYILPKMFGDFLRDRSRITSTIQSKISDKQNEKIEASYRKNMDRAAKSEWFRAIDQDVSLFGKSAFKRG